MSKIIVPKHYRWLELIDASPRIEHLANVVAAGDWVVALFPRFFEQIAEWLKVKPMDGLLDVGSAGFRGFDDASDAKSRVENVEFATGDHGAGVDVSDERKISAITAYIVHGDKSGFGVFRNQTGPNGVLSFFSNVSWLVWGALALLLASLVWGSFLIEVPGYPDAPPLVGIAFLLFLLGLLFSV